MPPSGSKVGWEHTRYVVITVRSNRKLYGRYSTFQPAEPSRTVVEQCGIQHSLADCCKAIKEAFDKILVPGRPH